MTFFSSVEKKIVLMLTFSLILGTVLKITRKSGISKSEQELKIIDDNFKKSASLYYVSEKTGFLININTASEAELQKLPGIGVKISKRILEYRKKNGKFHSLDELKRIKGIGEIKFNKLKSKIILEDSN